MSIRPIESNHDGFHFKIDNKVRLELAGSAVPGLGIKIPNSGPMNDFFDSILKQFDMQTFVNDINMPDIKKIVIDSEVCRIDGKFYCSTSDLKKYVK